MAIKNKKLKIKNKKHKVKIKKQAKSSFSIDFIFNILFLFFLFSIFYFILGIDDSVQAAEIPAVTRDSIIEYAATGVGSPYVWGGDKWDPNNRSWGGADCSGYVIKAWQLPSRADYTTSVGHPYNTYSFYYQNTHWDNISRDNLAKGDILVYRSSGGGHMVIYHYGDKWGSPVVYEARSSKTGIIHGQRYFPSSFVARRRHNLLDSDPMLMSTVKKPNGQIINALPADEADGTQYLDFFGSSDALTVFNTDNVNATQVSANLLSLNILESRNLSVNPYALSMHSDPWIQNAYLALTSGPSKIFAQRRSVDGYIYQAKGQKEMALSNFISNFRPRFEVLYLTNPNGQEVSAKVLLMNNGKKYFQKDVKIAAQSVALVSFKRTKARFLSGVYVRVNSSGGRILASKKSASSYFAKAQPSSKLSSTIYLPNFNGANDKVILDNPGSKKVKVSVKYINDQKSYFTKGIVLGPKDVTIADHRKYVRSIGKEVFVKAIANAPIFGARLINANTEQAAEPLSKAAQTLYVSNFSAASDQLNVINVLGSAQKATIDVYANGALVYTGVYDVAPNSQTFIDLTATAAATYTDAQVRINAGF